MNSKKKENEFSISLFSKNNNSIPESEVQIDESKKKKKGFFSNLFSKKKVNNKIKSSDNMIKYENISIDKDEFNTKMLRRDELNVNLIYFDLNITNKENYHYFNNFKIDVVGGFHAIDDLNILENYLENIKNKDIPFIVLSSGTSGKEVILICKKYSFIKEVIIFCKNYNYNENYLKEYPDYVKKVFTTIRQVYDYIKTFGANKYKEGIERYLHQKEFIFSFDEIQMDKQFLQCPVITASEYDKCFYLVHKVYSHFFGNMNDKSEKPMFNTENFNELLEYLNQLDFQKEHEKMQLINQFKNLVDLNDNNTFIERSIREYTGESNFCYLFNRVMRNFEKGLISFAHYMGPFLYGVNKYVKENSNFAISKKMKLYRIIQCSKLDFYQYKLNFGHIICFPSLTSTSSKPIKFKPTKLSQKINNNTNEMVKIKMIFKYKYKKGNISPGIIVENKKIKDGTYLSKRPSENEVILFPFTFAKIYKIEHEIENGNELYVIKLEIINRKSYIEYTLKDDYENRFLFSKLEEK